MQLKSIVAAALLSGCFVAGPAGAQVAADEQEFQALVAAFQANDVERLAAIATCTEQGLGQDWSGLARFMGVPPDQAAVAWCTRMTNGIAHAQLSLADVQGLDVGDISPAARKVLTTASEGK